MIPMTVLLIPPDDVEQILNFCKELVYINPAFYMISTNGNKIIVKCHDTSHVVMFRAELPKLTDWELHHLIRLEKMDVIHHKFNPKVMDINKEFKDIRSLTLYDKDMITHEGYSERDSKRIVLKFNRLTEDLTNDLLVRCNGYEACFNPYFMSKLFYDLPKELHCKLLYNDSPLIVKYLVDDITVYGIIAPKRIPHDSDYLDIIEV